MLCRFHLARGQQASLPETCRHLTYDPRQVHHQQPCNDFEEVLLMVARTCRLSGHSGLDGEGTGFRNTESECRVRAVSHPQTGKPGPHQLAFGRDQMEEMKMPDV